MSNTPTRLIFILSGTVLFIVLIGMVIVLMRSPQTEEGPQPTPVPTLTIRNDVIPPVMKDVPTVVPTQGGGININAPVVQESISEVAKLSSHLPYTYDFTSSTGIDVSIVIPQQNLQANRWTLKAQVFGVNYNIPEGDPEYVTMKQSFLEAAEQIFTWVRQHGADPEKILYVWGDKKFIQERAEKWLAE